MVVVAAFDVPSEAIVYHQRKVTAKCRHLKRQESRSENRLDERENINVTRVRYRSEYEKHYPSYSLSPLPPPPHTRVPSSISWMPWCLNPWAAESGEHSRERPTRPARKRSARLGLVRRASQAPRHTPISTVQTTGIPQVY